jgi:hypothetical protein
MRALAVVMDRVAAEYVLEVAAADAQQPVETVGADGRDETFGVGVGLWCADRCLDDVDSFAAEDLVEGGAEFAVAVVDQEPDALKEAREAEVARLLRDPRARRVAGAAREVDAAAPELDEKTRRRSGGA